MTVLSVVLHISHLYCNQGGFSCAITNLSYYNKTLQCIITTSVQYLSILEGASTSTAELVGTLGTPEVHAPTPGQVIAHVAIGTIWEVVQSDGQYS